MLSQPKIPQAVTKCQVFFYVHMGNSCVLYAHFFETDSPLHPQLKLTPYGHFNHPESLWK